MIFLTGLGWFLGMQTHKEFLEIPCTEHSRRKTTILGHRESRVTTSRAPSGKELSVLVAGLPCATQRTVIAMPSLPQPSQSQFQSSIKWPSRNPTSSFDDNMGGGARHPLPQQQTCLYPHLTQKYVPNIPNAEKRSKVRLLS